MKKIYLFLIGVFCLQLQAGKDDPVGAPPPPSVGPPTSSTTTTTSSTHTSGGHLTGVPNVLQPPQRREDEIPQLKRRNAVIDLLRGRAANGNDGKSGTVDVDAVLQQMEEETGITVLNIPPIPSPNVIDNCDEIVAQMVDSVKQAIISGDVEAVVNALELAQQQEDIFAFFYQQHFYELLEFARQLHQENVVKSLELFKNALEQPQSSDQ